MTTKFHHLINPIFTIAPVDKNFLVKINTQDLVSSMDEHLENLRKTMMMHQQLFKHQVQELHRLYYLQKKLMQELENRQTQQVQSHQSSALEIGHTTFQAPFISVRSEDPRDLSGSCSGADSSKMPIKFDLESQPKNTEHLIEDQKDLKKMDEENEVEVELTLSIGSRKPKSRDFDQTNRVGEIESPNSSVKITEGPKWLLQDLSLNRT